MNLFMEFWELKKTLDLDSNERIGQHHISGSSNPSEEKSCFWSQRLSCLFSFLHLLPKQRDYFHVQQRALLGLIFSYHLMPQPGFELRSVELHQDLLKDGQPTELQRRGCKSLVFTVSLFPTAGMKATTLTPIVIMGLGRLVI